MQDATPDLGPPAFTQSPFLPHSKHVLVPPLSAERPETLCPSRPLLPAVSCQMVRGPTEPAWVEGEAVPPAARGAGVGAPSPSGLPALHSDVPQSPLLRSSHTARIYFQVQISKYLNYLAILLTMDFFFK